MVEATPAILTVADGMIASRAKALLAANDRSMILTRLTADELIHRCRAVDAIFADADGTIVNEGTTTLAADYATRIELLAAAGVSVTLVTGKPHHEIEQLLKSFPPGLPLNVMYEKGAYYLELDPNGKLHKRYLLSTPELEASVADLRKLFLEHKAAIEAKYLDDTGVPRIVFGWSGSGTHESVLSIDIFAGTPPEDYLHIVGSPREALKVKDPTLLAKAEADLQSFVDTYRPGWKLVHLGNGNSEIAPGSIEKDAAIMAMSAFASARQVIVLGDSGNDYKMFSLRTTKKVLAGLVLHREKSLELVRDVDMVSFGMANARPVLDLVLAARV